MDVFFFFFPFHHILLRGFLDSLKTVEMMVFYPFMQSQRDTKCLLLSSPYCQKCSLTMSSLRDWSFMRWREVGRCCCPERLYSTGARS